MESYASDSIVLRGHSGPVYDVQFLPEGNAVLSASEDTSGTFVLSFYNSAKF